MPVWRYDDEGDVIADSDSALSSDASESDSDDADESQVEGAIRLVCVDWGKWFRTWQV